MNSKKYIIVAVFSFVLFAAGTFLRMDYMRAQNDVKSIPDELERGRTALDISLGHPYAPMGIAMSNFGQGLFRSEFVPASLFLLASLSYLWIGLRRGESNNLIRVALTLHFITCASILFGVVDVYFECRTGGGFCGLLGLGASSISGTYLFPISLIVLVLGLWKLRGQNTTKITSSPGIAS
jgi:hypothetical protein